MFTFVFVFFFQAEDGIRDYKVTGVQTCALPISADAFRGSMSVPRVHRLATIDGRIRLLQAPVPALAGRRGPAYDRSEERRVGKEGGGGWDVDVWSEKIETALYEREMVELG